MKKEECRMKKGNSMKRTPIKRSSAASALVLAFSLQPFALLAQGSLTPPGAPGPTMRTLTQVEPRSPISSAPFTISVPGSYYLTTNLTVSTGDAITIATNGVALDLSGFTVFSTAPSATGCGIRLNSGLRNLAIVNGFIQGGVTNNAGTYNGPGFLNGIRCVSGDAPVNARVTGVSVSGCLNAGIYLGQDESTAVEYCTVRTVGAYGIVASLIKSSVAVDCGDAAIDGDQVSDSRGVCTGAGYGLRANTALNCYGSSSSSYGLSANIAQNCYGYSSSNTGLSASNAQNCQGYSTTGAGLVASRALHCFGASTSGAYGLYAFNASFCDGSRTGGRAIDAIVATGCYAEHGTNKISYKYNMP